MAAGRHRLICAVLCLLSVGARPAGTQLDAAAEHHARGVRHHLDRSLDQASREYVRTLEIDPPRDPTPEEWALIRRFIPRVYLVPAEFFPLKDFAVILHPDRRLIAYHFFWEDDIDFPEDNDPCDHEVMWVQYSPDRQSLEKVWTYFHGRILTGAETAMGDARQHAMRPRVNVQWGKHGSMPAGWEEMPIVANEGDAERKYLALERPITLLDYNKGTFEKLYTEGRRLLDHPIGRRLGWPERFQGDWKTFVDFSRLLDPMTLLEKTRMAKVSRWNSATINQQFLTYNFRPKTEWPVDVASEGASAITPSPSGTLARRLDDFQLPSKSVFDSSMPRYPNAWFYVDASLVTSHADAVALVTGHLREAMRLREFRPPLPNTEGCDFEARLEHLQPWEDVSHRALQHAHAFHIRYYYSALARQHLEQVTLDTATGQSQFFRFAASAHYEVEHTNPNHADVEICPICGRTGEYRDLKGNLVELVHDPLGLELLLTGAIRSEPVRFEDFEQREVGNISALKTRFSVQQFVFPAQTSERNTLRIGIVMIGPPTGL